MTSEDGLRKKPDDGVTSGSTQYVAETSLPRILNALQRYYKLGVHRKNYLTDSLSINSEAKKILVENFC